MDHVTIRKVVIAALASDDVLYEKLVLKGGNALNLVHKVGARTSLDLDYSMAQDFDDFDDVSRRIKTVLERAFAAVHCVVLDFEMTKQPVLRGEDSDPTWGGYRVLFKIVERSIYEQFADDLHGMRVRAISISPRHDKKFKIDISKFEYVEGKIEKEVNHYTLFVYTVEMIAAEKMRAICQQLPEYGRIANPSARARDFYDIYSIATARALRTEEFLGIVVEMFKQKQVPLEWLARVPTTREFHRQDWPSVADTLADPGLGFDHFFDYVVDLAEGLLALRAASDLVAPGVE